MKKTIPIIALTSILVIVAIVIIKNLGNGEDKVSNQASVRLNWIPSCSFSGEVLGARDHSENNGISLKLEPGGPGIDPIKLVQSGANTFGVAGSDLVLVANDKGADLVIIGLVSYDSPGVWLAKEEKGIKTISDVLGKRIGELPGGNMQYLYEVFLKKTGLTRGEDFTPIPISFDLKTFITQDECDLRPVFVYDETSDLTLQGIKYSLIEPKNFGIQFKGICYFCKRETVDENPVMVQKFINTMARGWEDALNDPEKAIEALKEFDGSIGTKKELLGLKTGEPYFSGYQGKVLTTDTESWNAMAKTMVELGFIKISPNLDKLLQMQFVQNYHAKD
jgi:ABC-type nitrate/sulfonate/bicarbonate transport system substrate-binding protein